MSDQFINELVDLTQNAEVWSQYLAEHASRPEDVITTTFARTRYSMHQVLMGWLNRAIEVIEEYSRPLFADKIVSVFDTEEIVRVTWDGQVYFDVEGIAGSDADLWDGIQAARAQLATARSGKISQEQKARFWKFSVYLGAPRKKKGGEVDDEDLWSKTISLRQEAWGDLAPYWLFLEHGTGESEYAYPRNRPTNFVYKATLAAQSIFDKTRREVESEAGNIIEGAVGEFVQNPSGYEPYDVLDTFFAQGREYKIYVTSKRRIGAAQSKTFRQLRREYGT